VIGCDGGGSKTHVRIADITGKILGEKIGGASNPNYTSKENLKQTFKLTIHKALSNSGLTADAPVTAVFMGISGVSSETDQNIIQEALAYSNLNCSNNSICIDHDLRIALSGGLAGKAGIALIAGTGSACYGINANRDTYQCGGWGSLTDDVGSGSWIGRKALEAAVRQTDKRDKVSGIKKIVYDFLDIKENDAQNFRRVIRKLDRSEIAKLCPTIIALCVDGDPIASNIITNGVNGLCELVETTLFELQFPEAPLVFAGKLLTYDGPYQFMLREELHKRNPALRIEKTKFNPVDGAVIEALKLAGITIDTHVLNNITKGLSGLFR